MGAEPVLPPHIARQTLCMAGSIPGVATHAGEEDFTNRLHRLYHHDESNVAERLVLLKQELSSLEGESFWARLMEGMTDICHAQFAFVSKRILVDDHTVAVEMPRIGEEGSCLMAVALYYNDGIKTGMHRDYKYYAWSCPCAYMKHDKVFLIERDLNKFIQNNPNTIPIEPESYLGVPLFANGKCYAHFGTMWTKDGLKQKQGLSWAYIEMFMHSLEDMISAKLLNGQGFAKAITPPEDEDPKVIPQSAVMATQSLKLYARSLSHELRTPMQGVVGMLDLMYATVQEQLEGQMNQKVRQIFQILKTNIEVVQDSSKRAVEAADNVVQAYDLNMQIPETPTLEHDSPLVSVTGSYFDVKPLMTEGSQIINPNKRKRDGLYPSVPEPPTKLRHIVTEPRVNISPPQSPLTRSIEEEVASPKRKLPPLWRPNPTPRTISMPAIPGVALEPDMGPSTPGFRQSNIRESLPVIITDSLRVGGRPDFAVTEPIPLGERIEVKTRSSNGYSCSKLVTWTVDVDVPYVLPIDERDLSKLVGAVFLNALKFTDAGAIDIRVKLSTNKRYVLISVKDTGAGIAPAFQPELFKAFSKEDDKITRSTEGLGLGLMVAKGLARKIGGDLHLVRSVVDGPDHGSEFEMRFPLEACDLYSRASTPVKSLTEGSIPRSVPPTSTSGEVTPLVRTPPAIETPTPVLDVKTNGQHSREREKSPIIVSPKPTRPTRLPPSTLKSERRLSSTPKTPAKFDRQLASKYPLTFLVAEDNKINRKLLVQMLNQLGYKDVHEAYDGNEAVRVMTNLVKERSNHKRPNTDAHHPSQPVVDVVLMDLWMPELDGYGAAEQIFAMFKNSQAGTGAAGEPPTILAVSADVTDEAIDRATKIGMAGYMSKPFKVLDLQKLILEFCVGKWEAAATAA